MTCMRTRARTHTHHVRIFAGIACPVGMYKLSRAEVAINCEVLKYPCPTGKTPVYATPPKLDSEQGVPLN